MNFSFLAPVNSIKPEPAPSKTTQQAMGSGFASGLAEAVTRGQITLPGKTELDQFDLSRNKLFFEDYRTESQEDLLSDHIDGLLSKINQILQQEQSK